jgi:Spy/CpxP family protein refolding chaperone
MSQRFEEMRKLFDESSKQIEKILTKAQKPEFQKMMEERKERMKSMGQGMPEKPAK